MASTVLFPEDYNDKASSSGSEHEHWPEDFRKSPSSSPKAAAGYDSHNGLRTHVYQAKKDPSPKPADTPKDKKPEDPKPAEPRVIYVQAQPQQTAPQPYTYYPSQYVHGGQLQPQPMIMYNGQPVQYVYAAAPAPAPASAEKKDKDKEKPKKDSPQAEFTYIPKKSEEKKKSTNPWVGRTKAQVDEDNAKIAKELGAYEKRKVVPADAKPDQPFWVVENDGSHTLR